MSSETAVQAKSKESIVSYSDHASHCKLNKQVIGDDNSLSVEQLLLNTEKGRMILEHQCEGKKLEDKQRDFIVRIIISTICNTYPDKKLTNDFWVSVGKQIVTLFPAEDLDCYYSLPIRKVNSTDKKFHAAKGKLLNRYRNKKSSYKKFCDKETNECIATSNPDLLECKKWLQSNVTPWESVKSHWLVSFSLRRQEITESDSYNIVVFFDDWKSLKHPKAHELIDSDFKTLGLT
ncbi:hypothetical protein PV325_009495 [Microctonus aethiopoides]|nr:hypothetical protein PV325_009495 [Microctonus aethiopoides]